MMLGWFQNFLFHVFHSEDDPEHRASVIIIIIVIISCLLYHVSRCNYSLTPLDRCWQLLLTLVVMCAPAHVIGC